MKTAEEVAKQLYKNWPNLSIVDMHKAIADREAEYRAMVIAKLEEILLPKADPLYRNLIAEIKALGEDK